MDDVSIILTILGIVAPFGAGSVFYSWRGARRSGMMEEKMNELEGKYGQHAKDDADFQKTVGQTLQGAAVDIAAIKTDIAWIKDTLKNGKKKD